VLAVEWTGKGRTTLGWVDPLTLRAVPGGQLVSGVAAWPATRSPGGRFLLTTSASTATLFRVVDLARKRVSPVLELPGASGAHALWSRPDRIVAVTFRKGKALEAIALAPSPLRIVRRTPLSGTVVAARVAGARLVVLLGPREGIGPLRLAIVDGEAAIRTVALDGIAGGWESRRDGDDFVLRQAIPALAVDPSGRRAAVVGRVRYADVDLVSPTATTHPFAERYVQKRSEGWTRSGVWASGDRLAVTGWDFDDTAPSPAGLRLVDLSDAALSMLDSTSTQVARVGRALVGWGGAVSVYELDGTNRFRLANESAEVMAGPSFLYLNDSRDRTRFRVVDPSDGRVLRRAQTARPLWIVQLP
jgi:hypothetical protein